MNVYFVRHGESVYNKKGLYQDAQVPLSERGEHQAAYVAERFSSIVIDRIITSTFLRAKKTAQIIQKKIHAPLTLSSLFVEYKKPTLIEHRPVHDPDVMKIRSLMFEKMHDDSFRHSDEENFSDLKKRAEKALRFIRGQKEENILVVTHGEFLRMIVAVAMFGEKLTSHELVRFLTFLETRNTGITYCAYTKENGWKLIIWNDHAHLGETRIKNE